MMPFEFETAVPAWGALVRRLLENFRAPRRHLKLPWLDIAARHSLHEYRSGEPDGCHRENPRAARSRR